jgi:hypothetical protein
LVDSAAASVDATTTPDAMATPDAIVPLDALPSVACDGGTPIPSCVEYYALLETCDNRPGLLALACQPGLLDTPDADIQGIEMLCSINLSRLQQACR